MKTFLELKDVAALCRNCRSIRMMRTTDLKLWMSNTHVAKTAAFTLQNSNLTFIFWFFLGPVTSRHISHNFCSYQLSQSMKTFPSCA